MLHWKSKIEGGAAEARSAGRKVVQPELAKLSGLVMQLLKKHKVANKPLKKNSDETDSLFALSDDLGGSPFVA